MLHFVNFRNNEELYHRAVKVFDEPDFYHYFYDTRSIQEAHPSDIFVFANMEAPEDVFSGIKKQYSFNDSERTETFFWLLLQR